MAIVSSLYVHVPFCRHLCNYCDFYKRKLEPQSNQLKDYGVYLQDSWKRHESLMREHEMSWGALETVYLGGGTPSLWGVEGAELFTSLWGGKLPLRTNAEFTFEVDPGAWTEETLQSWEQAGVNRFSVGTQALDPAFLQILDRDHNRDQVFKLLERLHRKNFSVDLLLGAPHSMSRKRDVLAELTELLKYGPNHVSLYILNPAAGYALRPYIPDDEWSGGEYLAVSEFLRANGFHHYEVSNFALPGKESRHNLRYWLGESVAALGPTGTGYFAHKDAQAFRYKWKPSMPEIESESLGENELRLEQLYLGLRLDTPFTTTELLPRFEPEFDLVLRSWEERGLVRQEGPGWRMLPAGWVVLDSLINEVFSAIPAL